MGEIAFYKDGLSFTCARCSSCCRYESGFVYLSENDLSRLAKAQGMNYSEFILTWCRWIPFIGDRERLSLKEKSNFDCIFYGYNGADGCSVYDARPLQCRTFPFWDSIMVSREAWKNTGKNCPGINSGELHGFEEIENCLRSMEEEPVIERIVPE